MAFIEITDGKNKGKYLSESGKVFTKKQVELFQETKFDKRKLIVHSLGKAMRGEKK